MKNDAFHRIHHIDEKLNRAFSLPLLIGAFVVMVLMVFSTYRMRVALSLFINLFFNRPAVYLSYIGQWISRPVRAVLMSLFYLIAIGAYALVVRLRRPHGTGWIAAPPEDEDAAYFQS